MLFVQVQAPGFEEVSEPLLGNALCSAALDLFVGFSNCLPLLGYFLPNQVLKLLLRFLLLRACIEVTKRFLQRFLRHEIFLHRIPVAIMAEVEAF